MGRQRVERVEADGEAAIFAVVAPCARDAPALKERFNALGAEPAALETAAFRQLLADEGRSLSALIKNRQIVVE